MTDIKIYDYIKGEGNQNPIIQEGAHHRTSDKYKFQNTDTLINRLEGRGLEVIGKSFAKPRKAENLGFQKHIVLLSNDEMQLDDTNKLQLLVTNNHMGTGSLQLDLGIYRTVCANGLVVGDNLFHHSIAHRGGFFYDKVDEAVEQLFERMPNIVAHIRNLQETDTTVGQRSDYIQAVAAKLLGDRENLHRINFRDFNPRRQEDLATDAYTVYNRIQEVALKGGLRYQSIIQTPEGDVTLRNNTTRKVKSIDRQLSLNKYCWDKATELLLAA